MTPREAIVEAARTIRLRGWAPGHCWIPSVSPVLGAQPDRGPVCLISAMAHAPGPAFAAAYQALAQVTGGSVTTWEGQPGRTRADALGALRAALDLL